MMQGIDSMNPLRGVTVAAFEAWNMQYATLTDKAAKDFAVIPGLAKSWEGSGTADLDVHAARRPEVVRRPAADGRGRRLHDQPLARRGVAQPLGHDRQPDRHRDVADEVVINSKVPDPKLPTMDVYIVPKHVYEKYDAKGVTKWNGQTDVGRARSRSPSSRRASSPASRRTRTSGAASRRSTRS